MIVPQEYYLNTNVCFLAKDLLGKLLISNIDNQFCSGIIVETEAYRGPDDIASHSFANRRTLRNNTMYLKGGCSYVYICYGIHNLFNVITAHENVAHAVLIRAIEPVDGIDFMVQRRPEKTLYNNLTKGPGSLSQALGINKNFDSVELWNKNSPIQIHNLNTKYASTEIASSLRIGVESAGESALWPWRYFIKSSPYISAHKKIFIP